MERKVLLRLGVWLLCTPLFFNNFIAQQISWEKSLGGKHSDVLTDAIPTPDYGYILAGSSLSSKSGSKTTASLGDLDYCIWKMNEKGELEWQKSYGGAGTDVLQAVQLTKDGGFILGGISNSETGPNKKQAPYGNDDFWIIKLNAKGEVEWEQTLGGSGQEKLQSIVVTSDGFVLGGSSSSYKENESEKTDPNSKKTDSFGSLDYWIVKLDNQGKTLWQKSFGGLYVDELKDITVLTNGNIIVGGYSNSPISGNKTQEHFGLGDYWLIGLNKSGEALWQKSFGGKADDQLFSLTPTKDGGFLVGGNSNSEANNSKKYNSEKGSDFWMLKFNADLQEEWQKTYDFGQKDVLTSIIENKDGSLLMAGYAQSEAKTNMLGKKANDAEGINDYIALKTNAKGEMIWQQIVGSKGDEVMKRAIETRDGGYVLAGTSNGKGSRDKKGGEGDNDFWVVKLQDPDKPQTGKQLLEAFPNPATTFTNVVVGYEYTEGEAGLFDLNGRLVRKEKIEGNRTIPIELMSLPIGVYVIEVTTNVQKDSIKIIKK